MNAKPQHGLTTVLSLLFLCGCATTGDRQTPELGTASLFFATDRSQTKSNDDLIRFGTDRGEMTMGTCSVQLARNLNNLNTDTAIDWSAGLPVGPAILTDLKALPLDEFSQALEGAFGRTGKRDLMILVHGFNVSFEKAAFDAAQFADDLDYPGVVLIYSWPSRGSLSGYFADTSNAAWTAHNLKALIDQLIAHQPHVELHLIAHSMGCRALGEAAREITPEQAASISNVIFIAPDIDADIFRRDIAPRLKASGLRTTLYASTRDKALEASKAVNAYPRAGDALNALVVVDGVETIDASTASGGILGHSYFLESPIVLSDLYDLLTSNHHAAERPGLSPTANPDGTYWIFE